MRTSILIGISSVLVLNAPVVFGQAAAETVLLNQSSAAATAKAGGALGSSLNKAGSHLGGQIQNIPQSNTVRHTSVVAHKSQSAPQARQVAQTKNPPAAGAKPASGGSMITSVQGGRVTRPSPPATPQK